MGFEDRLRRVRGEAAAPLPTVEPAGPSLGERLARLQAARRPSQTAQEQTAAADPQALAAALGGELVAPGLVRVERRIPLTQPQGRIALGDGLAAMAGLVRDQAAGPPAGDPSGWRLLDTETSGLAGGTGTWVFACGIGRVVGSLLVLEQYVLASLDAEAAFLAAVSAALAGARGLVSYNGKSFDLPLLTTRLGLMARDGRYVGHAGAMADKWQGDGRYVGHAGAMADKWQGDGRYVGHAGAMADKRQGDGQYVPDPCGPGVAADEAAWGKTPAPCLPEGIPHLDLLHPIRRAFAPVWPDCRLATAEARLLGLVRRGDLPGALAPAAWLDWLRRGRTQPLGEVLAHNRQDILSLAALAAPLALTLSDPARTGADPTAVAAWHQDRGDSGLALAVLEANRNALPVAGRLRLARLRARAGDLAGAQALWEPLAEGGEPQAITALAKLYEHRLGDPARALVLARCLPPGDERERRCRRLLGRLARGANPPLDLAPGSDGAFVPSALPSRLRVGAVLPAL